MGGYLLAVCSYAQRKMEKERERERVTEKVRVRNTCLEPFKLPAT